MAGKFSKRSSSAQTIGASLLRGVIRNLSQRAGLSLDRSQIRGAAERYLDSLHFTLYADWDISKPGRRAEAAEWLTNQVNQVLDQMDGDDA